MKFSTEAVEKMAEVLTEELQQAEVAGEGIWGIETKMREIPGGSLSTTQVNSQTGVPGRLILRIF